MTDAIDLTTEQRKTLKDLLRRFLPGVAVWAYGSRVKWTARPNSDLDLVAFTTPAQRAQVADLKDALAESNLPFPVDLHVWDDVPERFREVICKDYVVVQEAKEPDGKKGLASEWPTLSLREAHVKLIDCDHRTPPAAEEGYPYVAIPQLRNGRIDLSEARRISYEHFTDWTRKAMPAANDVVLSRRCNPGETAFVPPGLEFALGQNLVLLRADGVKVYPPFLRWLVQGPEWWEQIGKFLNVGAVFDSLRCADVPNFELQIPPMPEQRAIAHILGTLDDKIELNRRMNETLEAMARALFKSWFVDFDPVRAKAEGRNPGLPQPLADLFPDAFEDSELGEIPRGWEVAPLPNVIEVNPTRPLRKGDMAPYLDMANMPTRGHTPDAVVDRPFGSGMRFMNGDTLVARITPCLENGKTAYVDFLGDEEVGWGSTEYIVLRPKAPLPWEFAYCLARSSEFREFAIQSMTGSSGRQRVPAESLSHYLVVTPGKEIAEQFGQVVGPLFSRASNVASESRTLSSLRDALLPRLLSGELRGSASQYLAELASGVGQKVAP